jgi:hypothetical protein
LLRSVLALPPPEQIEAWFQTNQIYRGTPNSAPVSEVLSLLVSGGRYLQWLNELGPITWLMALCGLLIAVAVFVRGLLRAPTSHVGSTPAHRARTVLALFLGIATGFVVFGYHAWYYFVVVHQLPLIVAPICLAVAFTVSLLLDAASLSSPQRVLAWVALTALVGERLYLQWANVSAMGLRSHPNRTRWGSFDVGPPGGMYGDNGQLVLGIAAVALVIVLCVAAYAFLRVRPPARSVQAPRREPSSRRSAPAEVTTRLV